VKLRRNRQPVRSVSQAPFDKVLFLLITIIVILGVVFVADVSSPSAATHFGDAFFYTKQHVFWSIVGFALMIGISRIHYSFWEKYSYHLFFVAVGFLLLVLLPGFGNKLLGARRWLSLGPLSFQPSELGKLSLIVYLATLYQKKKPLQTLFVPIGIISALVIAEPDLGTMLLLGSIGFGLVFLCGLSYKDMFIASLVAVVCVAILAFSSSYRRDRVHEFLDVLEHPLQSSYHVKQALFAIANGGVFGVGFGQSRQKHLFLPEAATDSVFPIIAEEVGFVGVLALLGLFLGFIFRMFWVSKRAPDVFSKVVSSGIALWIGSQIVLNLASMVALVPLTGIPLPFLSYGKTSLLVLFIATGILLNISRHAETR
jgi:cell division protein FtsW